LILFSACTTAARRLDAIEVGTSLLGMLYDSESRPVSSCRIVLDGVEEESVTSDINGRYIFEYAPYGRHSLSFHKDGYEDYSMVFDFANKSQVVYSRLVSRESLFSSVTRAIGERKWGDASSYLARADAIGKQEPLSSYLSALISYRMKDYASAAAKLEALPPADYREPYLFLFLADIYELHLGEKAKAAFYLKAYLAVREDDAIRARLENIGN
jgi:hypothetical protein